MPDRYNLITDVPYYENDMPKSGNLEYLDERCRLDIYYPETAALAPTVLFFHGGGLSAGEKFIPETLKNAGLIVVSANYRLSSDRAKCPDYINDAAAAAVWVFRHIAEYGGDPDVVFVSGGSGGAYLAAMIGMAPQFLAQFGESNRRFAALMPISGQMTTHFQIINERNGTAGMTQPLRAVIDEFAPLHYASPDLSPIILYAGDPKIEWPTRAEENALLAATLTRVAGHPRTELFLFPGFDHGNVYEPAYVLIRKRAFLEMGNRMRGKLKPPPPEIVDAPCRTDFQTRMGGTDPFGTRALWSHDGEYLTILIECPDQQINDLPICPNLWSGNCVEIWIEDSAGVCRQWGIGIDGQQGFNAVGATGTAARTKAFRNESGWSAEIRIPLKELVLPVKANLVRHRVTKAEETYTNWSPIFSGINREPEAFVELKIKMTDK